MSLLEKPIANIEHLIPQKAPFVMVDSLLSFSENRVISSFTITENNIFFKNKALLEPGLIENMAQTIALHTGYDFFLKGKKAPTGYIGSIKIMEISRLPKLAETILTEVKILQEFNGITLVEIGVFDSDKEQIAFGQMKTVIAT